MSEEKKSSWITRYGVPSLVLSAAALLIQQQQQTFDRLQRILEGGYQFYSTGRTSLQYSGDADREMSLLKIVGNAFPNIYCDVRQDLYQRSSVVQPEATVDPQGRKLIDSPELKRLWARLETADRPVRREYPENIIEAWTSFGNGAKRACDALGNGEPAAPSVLASAAPADAAPPATPPPPAAEAARPAAPTPPAAAPGRIRTPAAADLEVGVLGQGSGGGGLGSLRGSSASRDQSGGRGPALAEAAEPAASAAPAAPEPNFSPVEPAMRVFFQIPGDAPDGLDNRLVEETRAELEELNYQVMRNVERIPPRRFPQQPEVRYFGPRQEEAAKQLAEYLSYRFRNLSLKFVTVEIGGKSKGMPWQNLEVLVPSPSAPP